MASVNALTRASVMSAKILMNFVVALVVNPNASVLKDLFVTRKHPRVNNPHSPIVLQTLTVLPVKLVNRTVLEFSDVLMYALP